MVLFQNRVSQEYKRGGDKMNAFYHGDCLFVMNHDIPAESVDLIYLDPPFFTGKVQKGTKKWQPGAMEVSYEDSKKFWGDSEKVNAMRTKSPEWLKHIAQTRPDFASYLFYMKERLEACHQVLQPTGSIYLHCDWRASHYLKMIMDEIFGYDNFRNEVIWCYSGASSPGMKQYAKKHDTIFYYSKSAQWTFNPDAIRQPYSLTSKSMEGRPKTFHHGDKTICELNPLGKYPEDWFYIPTGVAMAKERVGYPTQKPLALLKHIIKASSNEGDVVLDPFCGCGTAIIAAQRLHRQWIGIDISKDAYEVSGHRINELPLDFTHLKYVERTLKDVLAIQKPQGKNSFEEWVNEYFQATKPMPDEGVDGISPNGVPIQTKTFLVSSTWVRKLFGDAKLHPQVKQPCNHVILVSQKGFDDGARQQQFKIQTKEGIKVDLFTPTMMLSNNGVYKEVS